MIAEALTALAKFMGVADKVASMIQAHQQEVAGVNKERAAENAASAEVNANVADAAIKVNDAAALDRLFDSRG